MKKFLLALIIIVAAAAGVGVASYYALGMINDYGSAYYKDMFFPGTYINGVDYSEKQVDAVKEELQRNVLTYELDITERGGTTEKITGDMLDLKYVDDGAVDALLANQDLELWRYYITNETSYTVESAYSFSEDKVKEVVSNLACLQEGNIVKPTDAYIDDDEEKFFIVPETEGNSPIQSKVEEMVISAVKGSVQSIDLEEGNVYERPKVFSDDETLNSIIDNANMLISGNIVYDFSDRQYTIDRALLKSWLLKDSDGNYYIDESQAAQWVTDLAYETDTFGLPRKFMTSYGVEIELEGGGDYGWCIDKEDTTTHLMEYINQGANVIIQPDYLYTANDRSVNDIGGNYIEVCIDTQTLFCYHDGELVVQTPVITGNDSTGHSTPSGSCWAIDGKWDVESFGRPWKFTNYANAYSDYWMPFNGDVGIHDASWQSAEAYTVYHYYIEHGSHGCVNTPYDAVKTAYENMKIGDPVIVYYKLDQVVGPEPTEEIGA